MSRGLGTVLSAVLLAVALGVIGATLPTPFVALGPGPTYDTLGDYEGEPIVTIDGPPTYPTSGHLNMTTVSVTTEIPLFTALGYWASGDRRLVPREALYPSNRTAEDVQQENAAQFTSSELNAVSAALGQLDVSHTVIVVGVIPGSPADGVLQLEDRIIAVAGREVTGPESVAEVIRSRAPGETVPITIAREGADQVINVALAAGADPSQGFLGILPGYAADPGSDIVISLGGIGGPSAGLMFSLAVLDKLTPGELTNGTFVAGTGSIGPSGVVGKIDGVPFKMVAARAAGADVFLVPAENCAEAVETAPSGLTLVRVETLAGAVGSLDQLRAGQAPIGC